MEMDKVIVGQKHMLNGPLDSLLSNGHILFGRCSRVSKNIGDQIIGKYIHANSGRLQFTPDLLPADLIGTMIYSQKKEELQ